MKLEKKVFVEVGEKITIVEPDPKYYKEREHLLGKEYTIKEIWPNNEQYLEKDSTTGKIKCPIDEIDVFFVEEAPEYEFVSENISIPSHIKDEIEVKENIHQRYKYLLSVMKEITVAESDRDMYDLARNAIKKYNYK